MESYVGVRLPRVDLEWIRRRDHIIDETASRFGFTKPMFGVYANRDMVRIMDDSSTIEKLDELDRWRSDEIQQLQQEALEYTRGFR